MITTGTETDDVKVHWSTGDVVGVMVGVIIAMVIINIVFVIRRGTPFVLIHIMYSKIIFKRLEQRRVGGTGEYVFIFLYFIYESFNELFLSFLFTVSRTVR